MGCQAMMNPLTWEHRSLTRQRVSIRDRDDALQKLSESWMEVGKKFAEVA